MKLPSSIDELTRPYDIKSVIEKYTFAIHEFVQTERPNDILIPFLEELNYMGEIRGNKFYYSGYKHDYKNYPVLEIYSTKLGNVVMLQSKDNIRLYMKDIYVCIK